MLLQEDLKSSLADIIRAETGSAALAITPIPGGMVNAVYAVRTRDRELVIRLNTGSLDVYRKEKWAMDQAAAAGVAVPLVFSVGERDTLSYMLMEKIDGVTGSQYTGDHLALMRELGRQAKLLNSIAVEGYGFHLDMIPQPHFRESWQECAAWEKDFIFGNDTLVRLGALDKSQFRQAEAFLEPMLDWKHKPHLSHSDLNPGNAMVGKNGMVYLIDWTQAKGAPAPFFEIGNFSVAARRAHHIAAFVEGYGLDRDEYRAIKPDCDRIGLASVLRAAVWAAGEQHPELPKFISDVRKAAPGLLPRTAPAYRGQVPV